MSNSGTLDFGETPVAPLAERMRPQTLDEFFGQAQVLGTGASLRNAMQNQQLHSMVFWGPPGTGKTTLARLLAKKGDTQFVSLSAVLAGVKDIREAVTKARTVLQAESRRTVLFVDEVHRFNKAQQDAFLPHIEDGTFFFVGATTENPSFALNNALLSRVRVYVLKRLNNKHLVAVLKRALRDSARGLGRHNIAVDDEVIGALAAAADGDARRALVLLELASDLALAAGQQPPAIDRKIVSEVSRDTLRHFDHGGDIFYDQISALHKSLRGSDPDAGLYWFCRLLDGGCDPAYLARRLLRVAAEDIGNADPRALSITLDAWQGFERLGSPEGELLLAQAVVYLACAAKSNAVYNAYKNATELAKIGGNAEVPEHLRNAPTQLMKSLGHGCDYRYSHDEPDAFSAGQEYFPKTIDAVQLYQPVERGLEKQIAEKLAYLRSRQPS